MALVANSACSIRSSSNAKLGKEAIAESIIGSGALQVFKRA